MTESKKYGRVYTPQYLVNVILDHVGYTTYDAIVNKHIIDNSCGNGAFIIEIVNRYCKVFNGTIEELTKHLQTYIHGIEINQDERNECIANLNRIVSQYGIRSVNWDILCADTLTVSIYNSKMDYVVGNPPYIRIHNLESSYNDVKSYHFANGGMTDLYLVFFEIGFHMLNSNGHLCYITPSSWLNSVAADNLRRFILHHQNLVALVDLEHYQAFDKITTYTLISHFQKSHCCSNFDYYIYNSRNNCCDFIENLELQDIYIDSYFYLGHKKDLETLRKIKTTMCPKYVLVKNGFATLADSVFIGDNIPESPITIKVLKGSTGKWYKCLFPYGHNGKPLSEEKIFEYENVKKYLLANKTTLLKGNPEHPRWYLFGRTQALKDVWSDKFSINTTIKDTKSIKLNIVPSGSGLYSGLYILTDTSFDIISDILLADEFINYISSLKKYKSGGYYTYNSKDLELYLNYKIYQLKQDGKISCETIDKRRVLGGNLKLF